MRTQGTSSAAGSCPSWRGTRWPGVVRRHSRRRSPIPHHGLEPKEERRTRMQGIIVSVAPAGDLLKVYPGQAGPQPCYLSLSVATGRLWAGANPELCNAVPEAVWHGIVRRYEIPVLQAATATALMQELVPLMQRVVEGAVVVWDGHNHVARLSEEAEEAEEAIVVRCANEEDVHWADAGDWLQIGRA